MQEVEAKRKLTPADGAHVFFTLIFLSGSYMALNGSLPNSCSVNLQAFGQALFYGQIIWLTYLIITLVPRYKNQGLRLFFNLLDVFYGLYHLALFIYTCGQFYSPQNDCEVQAPYLNFLANLYIHVMTFTFFVVGLAVLIWLGKRLFRGQRDKNISGFGLDSKNAPFQDGTHL